MLLSFFYDLTCQDVPPTFEDSHSTFSGAESWECSPSSLLGTMRSDPDDLTPSFLTQIKTSLFELAKLYTHRYPEALSSSNTVQSTALWGHLGGGQIACDGLVSQGLRFLSTVIRSGNYKATLAEREMIKVVFNGVVVPNVTLREHEVEQFEDDPLEYVRVDLSLAVSSSSIGGLTADGTTRRQGAADVLRALVASGFETETTEVVLTLIGNAPEDYNRKKGDEVRRGRMRECTCSRQWQLLVQLLSKVLQARMVHVVQFFSQHVYEDLQAD